MRPFCLTARQPVTPSRAARVSFAAIAAALGVCATAATALALVPDDLCTGNPCVISADVVIDSSVILDFGSGTELEFAPGVAVLLQNGATVHFQAGSISVGSAVRFRSAAPGSSLYLSAETGDLSIAATDQVANFTLRDAVELGLYSAGNLVMRAMVEVSGVENEAGAFSVQSFGNLTFHGRIRGDGNHTGFNASVISLAADGALSFDGGIQAVGRGGDSGQVSLSGATATLHGRISVKPRVGVGGNVSISANTGALVLNASVIAKGTEALSDTGNFCDGGQVVLTAGGSLSVNKPVDVSGGGPRGCRAGSVTAQAGTDFVQSVGAAVRASTVGYTSFGGQVSIQASGNVTLRRVEVGADSAGSISAAAGGTLDVFGGVRASSNGLGDAVNGSINLTGTCGLRITGAGRVVARQANSSGGQIGLTTSGGPMTIDGTVAASDAVNLEYVTGFSPTITGTIIPDPNLIEVSSGTCGG
jgi:filamentous hemagglutinin